MNNILRRDLFFNSNSHLKLIKDLSELTCTSMCDVFVIVSLLNMESVEGNPTSASPSPIGFSDILSGKFRASAMLIEGALMTSGFSPGTLVDSKFLVVFSNTEYVFLEMFFACAKFENVKLKILSKYKVLVEWGKLLF